MAHIEDRWYKTAIGPDGKKKREKTDLHGKGLRYRVRYIDPNGKEKGKSFPDKEKHEAEDFLISVENAKRARTYVDPDAGKIGFAAYADIWYGSRPYDPSSRASIRSRIDNHLIPFFGDRPIRAIRPEMINEWSQKQATSYEEGTIAVSFVVLKSIFSAAVDNKRIIENPCAAKTVNVPKQRQKEVVPWARSAVRAVRRGLKDRYQAMVDLGAGCGPRQGEIFGVGEDDFDFDAGTMRIRRQVKRVGSRLVFGLPKNDKERTVPLPKTVATAMKAHMTRFPPVMITLPWEDPGSERLATVPLVFTNSRKAAILRCTFDQRWARALRLAGLSRGQDMGMHALRHYYASVLIDAGESIKVVASNLGHSDPAFTWRTYVHLIKGTEDRTRQAIDRLALDDDVNDGLETA